MSLISTPGDGKDIDCMARFWALDLEAVKPEKNHSRHERALSDGLRIKYLCILHHSRILDTSLGFAVLVVMDHQIKRHENAKRHLEQQSLILRAKWWRGT